MLGFVIYLGLAIAINEVWNNSPKIEDAKADTLSKFKFPTATEGRPVPVVWGRVKIEAPNVIWYGDFKKRAIKESVKTGLFSSQSSIVGWKYFIGVQMAICLGELTKFWKIWADDKLIYDYDSLPGGVRLETDGSFYVNEPKLWGGIKSGGGIQANLDILFGGSSVPSNTYLNPFQSFTPSGSSPAYRGLAYMVIKQGYLGTSSNVKPWSFEVERCPTFVGLSNEKIGDDCNPVHVIYELLTSSIFDMGISTEDIDITNFNEAATTLFNEGNGFSMVLDNQITVKELLSDIQDQIDGVLRLNQSSGLCEIKLSRDDYDIDSVPVLDGDNTIEIVDYQKGTFIGTVNEVRIEFTDRDKEYRKTYANAKSIANRIIQLNDRVAVRNKFPGVKNGTPANNIAWRKLRQGSTPLAGIDVIANRELSMVQPGDVLNFNSVALGITNMAVRVLKVDTGELDAGRVKLEMMQDVFSVAAASGAAPEGTRWEEPSVTLIPFGAGNEIIEEAPLAFLRQIKDVNFSRVWATGVTTGEGELYADIRTRNSAGTPTGDYQSSGEFWGPIEKPLLIGAISEVATSLTMDYLVEAEEFLSADAAEIGSSLSNLIKIGNEYIAFEGITINGTTSVTLTGLHRNLLDSPPEAHADDDPVYLIFMGGNTTDQTFADTNNVDVKLIPIKDADKWMKAM